MYVAKRRAGGKSIGSAWKGRMCWAVTSVARRVGGRGFSGGRALVVVLVFELEGAAEVWDWGGDEGGGW